MIADPLATREGMLIQVAQIETCRCMMSPICNDSAS